MLTVNNCSAIILVKNNCFGEVKTMKTKRTYRIANKFRFITFLTVFMLITAFSVSAVFGFGSAAGSDVQTFKTVQVQPGDTLWTLAKQYGPNNVDCRKLIYEIQQINDVSAYTLQAGQYISIPESL